LTQHPAEPIVNYSSMNTQEMLLPSALTEYKAGPLDDSVRAGLAQRLAAEAPGVTWFAPSLTRAGDALFIAFEENGAPLLLQYGGTAGDCGLTHPTEISGHGAGHGAGHGNKAYVYPFASTDRENVAAFAERIDLTFLPRPQRDRPGRIPDGPQPGQAVGARGGHDAVQCTIGREASAFKNVGGWPSIGQSWVHGIEAAPERRGDGKGRP